MKDRKIPLGVAFLLANLVLINSFCSAQKVVQPKAQEDWVRDFEPFRIAGNLYYVGTYELASYLITTSQGNILINTGTAESVPMIRAHIRQLGFELADVKILLTNQVHYDHVGGMAGIKKLCHAKMMVDSADAEVLADGGASDFVMGGKEPLFEPVTADRLLHDQDTIRLGGMQVVILHHPGHTKGSCSFVFDVKDEGRTYRVLIVNMPTILNATKLTGMPTYQNVGKDYAYTLNELPKLQFDLWLCPHAEQFGLHQKHQPGDAYRPDVFIDRKGYDSTVNTLQKDYQKKLGER